MQLQIIDLEDPLWLQVLQQLRHDIYHLPEYLQLESRRTNTIPEGVLISEGDRLFFLPYLLRRCDDLLGQNSIDLETFDVVSPYGYPGILLSQAALDSPIFLTSAMHQLITTLRDKSVCSGFFRLHPILNQTLHKIYSSDICNLTGETIFVDLKLSEEEIWQQTRADHRKDINRQKRMGIAVEIGSFSQYFDEFIAIYEETMDRTQADKSYYFGHDFFSTLRSWKENLFLGVVKIEDEIASACLITECCGIVQTYLGGTKDKFLKNCTNKLLFDRVRFWGKERGNEFFHLGGGVGGSKDGVHYFKAGFSKQRLNFLTLRLVIDPDKYLHLVNLQAKFLGLDPEKLMDLGFFPAYRYSP